MVVLDAVQDKPLHKILLVEENGEYELAEQAANRDLVVLQGHLNQVAAACCWRKVLTAAFYRISHNTSDALKLAERHVSEVFG